MRLLAPSLAAAMIIGCTRARAASPVVPRLNRGVDWTWRAAPELSYQETSGNSQTRTLTGANTFDVMAGKSVLAAAYFRAVHGTAGDQTNVERLLAYEKARWFFDEENYAFEKLMWKRDRFAGLRSGWDLSAGVGRRVFHTKKDDLALELGGGQILEHRIGEGDRRGDTYKTYGRYQRLFGPGASFEQDGEYTHNLRYGRDARWRLTTSVTAPLSKRLSMRFTYEYDFARLPSPGVKRVDRTVMASLVISFGDVNMDGDASNDYGEISEDDAAPEPPPPPDPPDDGG